MILFQPINKFALYGYFLTTCLIPIHWLPKVFYALLWASSAKNFSKFSVYHRLSPIIVVLIYLYGGVLGGINGFLDNNSIGLIIGVLPFLGYYPIAASGLKVENALQVSGGAVSFYTVIKYLSDVQGITVPFLLNILDFMDKYSSISITEKLYFGEKTTYVSIGAAPILFVSLAIMLIDIFHKGRYLLIPLTALNLFAIVTSGSRALWFTSFAAIMFILNKKLRYTGLKLIFWFFCGIALNSFEGRYNITDLLSSSDFSNLVKISWVQSYFNNVKIEDLLFGGGIGVEIQNTVIGISAIQTEITLLEAIRMFGVLFGFLLFTVILLPSADIEKYRYKNDTIFIFFLYIIFSLTNPVLLNGIGALVVIWYWVEISDNNSKGFSKI